MLLSFCDSVFRKTQEGASSSFLNTYLQIVYLETPIGASLCDSVFKKAQEGASSFLITYLQIVYLENPVGASLSLR